MEYIYHAETPLGPVTLASDGSSLTGLWFNGQKYDRAGLCPDAVEAELPVFRQTLQWLELYFAGRQPDFTPPLAPRGSAFRREVWALLSEIPYGTLVTYGELSSKLAAQQGLERMSAQAVGGAVGHNPISLLLPCHRVVGADGSLTGYAGGVERKLRLLELEGIDTAGLYIPRKGSAL